MCVCVCLSVCLSVCLCLCVSVCVCVRVHALRTCSQTGHGQVASAGAVRDEVPPLFPQHPTGLRRHLRLRLLPHRLHALRTPRRRPGLAEGMEGELGSNVCSVLSQAVSFHCRKWEFARVLQLSLSLAVLVHVAPSYHTVSSLQRRFGLPAGLRFFVICHSAHITEENILYASLSFTPGAGHTGIKPRFPSRSFLVPFKLILSWFPCQAPGVTGSVLGLVGLASVYHDWVR